MIKVDTFPTGQCLNQGVNSMNTKYQIDLNEKAFEINLNRLVNQIWKLIPMREHNENWQEHLETLLIEIVGLNEVIGTHPNFISLLSKLEGIQNKEVEFIFYRKTVFEMISLLRGVIK